MPEAGAGSYAGAFEFGEFRAARGASAAEIQRPVVKALTERGFVDLGNSTYRLTEATDVNGDGALLSLTVRLRSSYGSVGGDARSEVALRNGVLVNAEYGELAARQKMDSILGWVAGRAQRIASPERPGLPADGASPPFLGS